MTSTVDVTLRTLEATPERALRLLRAVARYPSIRRKLEERGYTPEQHRRGRELVVAVTAVRPERHELESDAEVARAFSTLNGADEEMFGLMEASLKHHYPETLAGLRKGLTPSRKEAEAALNVSILLDRLAALEASNDPTAQAAIAKLAVAGLNPKERDRLSRFVAITNHVSAVEPFDEEGYRREEEEYYNRLRALRAWFEEWSGIARIVIRRRDELIRLGLAKPRLAVIDEGDDEDDDIVESSPTPITA